MSTSIEESDSEIGYTICAIIFIIAIFLFELLIAFSMFRISSSHNNNVEITNNNTNDIQQQNSSNNAQGEEYGESNNEEIEENNHDVVKRDEFDDPSFKGLFIWFEKKRN
ncbi:hypothetical protein ILUMI_13882 [Ignelater luminosus]|uniref:Transmembrane protein n=1 Tax=Ignelater luminosus TaxID=2038154 RepID=A0A8K0CZV6_IGNLU|nr:hypothetical protein ILUMI_13882 [Ignelater luminosus]